LNLQFWRDITPDRRLELALIGVLAVAAVLQLCVYYRQAGIMDKQAEISARQTEIAQSQMRPWVSAAPNIEIKDDLVHDPSGLQIVLTMTLKNSGQSVAQHTFFSFKTYLYSYKPSDEIRKVCKEAEESHNVLNVFPGDSIQDGVGVTIPEVEFLKLAAEFKAENNGTMHGIGQTIITCIAYKSSWEEKFHHTPYLLALNRADGKSTLLSEMMLNPYKIPFADVTLRQIPADLVGSPD
jgi:hypothetical protein